METQIKRNMVAISFELGYLLKDYARLHGDVVMKCVEEHIEDWAREFEYIRSQEDYNQQIVRFVHEKLANFEASME